MDESQVNYTSVRKVGKRPAFHTSPFKAGALIFNEGDNTRDTYFVVSGELSSFRKLGLQTIEIAHYREGDSFGELAVLSEKPRPFSVRADTDCQLMVIPPLLLIAQLQQASPWVAPAYEEFSIHLQMKLEGLNRSSVPDPLEALTLFLCDKGMKNRQNSTEPIQISFFDVQDEFSYLSRLSTEQVRKQVNRLNGLGLLTLNAKQEIVIQDQELLEMLYVALNHSRNGRPLNQLIGDPDIQVCLSTMPRVPTKSLVPKQTLLDLWNQSLRSGNCQSAFEQLIKLGAIAEDTNQMIRIHKSRCDWLTKAQHEIPIVLEKLKGQT